MQAPTWLKPGIIGAVFGGIATMIVGFDYGGWYLGSSAETLAQKRSTAAVVEALVQARLRAADIGVSVSSK